MLRRLVVPLLTDASGGQTVYSEPVAGVFIAAYLDSVDLAAGTDIAITETETTRALLTLTNVNTDALYQPRLPVHDSAGSAITGSYSAAPVSGTITVVVAQGGNAKTGTLYLYVDTLS